MVKRKYVRKSDGSVRGINTPNLNLEKPLGNENYDINIFNSNMDKIDTAIKNANTEIDNVKGEVQGLELTSTKVTRPNGKTVENSLSEHDREIESLKLSVSSGKKQVASAITDKGVPTLATDTFKTMSDNIRNIISYSELSIKISVQTEEPAEPKEGDLWLVTDTVPGRIILSHDDNKAIREEGLVFIKLKFLDIACNFNEQMASLLEIPNQVVIDFNNGDKRLDIRGVGIAKGGVIDLYADFSHAKIFKGSKFEYVQFKYYHDGQWITLDNGFDYMYIIRNGNIALFNPMSKSVIWEKAFSIRDYPSFGIDTGDKLLISGRYPTGVLLSRLDKQGDFTAGKYTDSEALPTEYLNIIGNSDGTTLLSYPQNIDYTVHVKLDSGDNPIWKISHADRVLNHFDISLAFHFLSGIIIDNQGGFAVVYYNQNRGALKEGNTCVRFFDDKGKQTGHNSNFFTLKTDHYIVRVKQNKKGEIFALATAKKDTSPVNKSILYKYDTYEDFKNRKISSNIAFTNKFYSNDFVVDSTKIIFMQYISSTSVKVTEINTDTMTKIKEVNANISNKTYCYSCDRGDNIITNVEHISPDGVVTLLTGLSQVADSSPNTSKYRCMNVSIEKIF